MSTLHRTLFVVLILALASTTAFSQDSTRQKADKKDQPEETKEGGLRKIGGRQHRNFDINIDEKALKANIEGAIENAMRSVDMALDKLEINIEPIEIDLRSLNKDIEPILINIPNINIDIEPIEVDLRHLDIDMDHHDIDRDDDEDHDEDNDNDRNHHDKVFRTDEPNSSADTDKVKDKVKNKSYKNEKSDKDKSDKDEKEKSKGLKKLN